MSNTPRGTEGLLGHFPNNTSGLISPQDVRDFVVSHGPGLDNVATFLTDPVAVPFSTGMPVGSGLTVYMPWANPATYPWETVPGYAYDPNGWCQFDADYPSPDWYFDTVPAGSWFLLPEGVYTFSSGLAWDTNTTGRRSAYVLDTCDNRVVDTQTQLDPYAWDPMYELYQLIGVHINASSLVDWGTGFSYQYVSGTIRVIGPTAPVAFASSLFQTSGSDRALIQASVDIMRHSSIGG